MLSYYYITLFSLQYIRQPKNSAVWGYSIFPPSKIISSIFLGFSIEWNSGIVTTSSHQRSTNIRDSEGQWQTWEHYIFMLIQITVFKIAKQCISLGGCSLSLYLVSFCYICENISFSWLLFFFYPSVCLIKLSEALYIRKQNSYSELQHTNKWSPHPGSDIAHLVPVTSSYLWTEHTDAQRDKLTCLIVNWILLKFC